MARKKLQQGRNKEAPQAVVRTSGLGDNLQNEQTFTSNDEEYQRYSDFLREFFGTLTRLQEILAPEEYRYRRKYIDQHGNPAYQYGDPANRTLSVFFSENGFIIQPGGSMEAYDPPEKILELTNITRNPIERGAFHSEFFIRPGPAGKQVFVDLNNIPIRKLEIELYRHQLYQENSLEIKTKLPPEAGETRNQYRVVKYWFHEDMLTISRAWGYLDGISDEYATHLFTTIKKLVPGSSTSPTPPERRVGTETPAPNALPPARRRSL